MPLAWQKHAGNVKNFVKFFTKGVAVNTDAEGVAIFDGFFGDYDIKVTANGKEVKVSKAFYMGCENVLEIVVE